MASASPALSPAAAIKSGVRTLVFLGLGSNLENPPEQIRRALATLKAELSEGDFAAAPLYRSLPLGGPPQPDYCNTACRFSCSRTPEEILAALQTIEARHGRRRDVHWGPRTLDLDLLLCGNIRLESPGLRLPHPGIAEREFVLVPLLDLDPGLADPLSGLAYSTTLAALRRARPSTLMPWI